MDGLSLRFWILSPSFDGIVLELVLEWACGVRRGASGRWRSGRIEDEDE
jgi:hypothetical protein